MESGVFQPDVGLKIRSVGYRRLVFRRRRLYLYYISQIKASPSIERDIIGISITYQFRFIAPAAL